MATAYITRTPAGTGSYRKMTISAWVKRGNRLSTNGAIWSTGSDTSNFVDFNFNDSDRLELKAKNGGSYVMRKATVALYRDPSAWYHIVAAIDTDQVVAADRNKIYINGVQYPGTWDTDTDATLNVDLSMNTTSDVAYVGRGTMDTSAYWSGSMSHVQFVDGLQLAPTEFGEVDSTSGIWKIKTTAYATPGTNGFYLKMEDRTNLDLDSSSNAFTFTTSGTLTATYDNPSNNFATMNPLDNYYPAGTFSTGNNTVVTTGGVYAPNISTLGMSGGKWYWEFKTTARVAGANMLMGITSTQSTAAAQELGEFDDDWSVDAFNGEKRNSDASTSYGVSWDTEVMGVALDLDNNKLYFGKDNVWMNSGVPTSGATGTGAISITAPASTPLGEYFAGASYWTSGGATFSWNFGNGYFGTTAVTSAEADGAGIGAFEYAPPTGYYALCTKNIKAYGG